MNLSYGSQEDECETLSDAELAYFRELLIEKQRRILDEARQTIGSEKITLDPNDMKDEVDLASVAIQQDLTFRLLDRSRKLLNEIQHALRKIDDGEYGYCEGTGELIPRKRLKLAPWVRHSVEHKERLEIRRRHRLRRGEEPAPNFLAGG